MTKGRLEAFSDGVIAIIITITILIIDLPEGNDMAALMGVMPLAICYLISFIMVGTNWANHHHLGLPLSAELPRRDDDPVRHVEPAAAGEKSRHVRGGSKVERD